jgi:hypothetical protein
MTKAEDMIREMIANPSEFIKSTQGHRERLTVIFPGPVELRSWSDPTTGTSWVTVEPKED